MIHHAVRGAHHGVRHLSSLTKHIGGFYARNPHKIVDHAQIAANYGGTAAKLVGTGAIKGSVHIGKMVWTHGPTVAKHTGRFMQRGAISGFKLFTT
jgi:hypothetical protein